MRTPLAWLGALLLLSAAVEPAPAATWPEIALELGSSFGVDGEIESVGGEDLDVDAAIELQDGGISLGLSALWPVLERARFGVRGFMTDVGSLQGHFTDANDPSVSVGTVEVAHVDVYGAAWRLELDGPDWGRLRTFVNGDLGIYRFEADERGEVFGAVTRAGWALGGGAEIPVGAGHAAGLTVRFDRAFDDFTRYWMSAAVEWRWRPGRG